MKTVQVKLTSISPYSQSRYHDSPKLDKERPDAQEARVWREKMHVTEDGHVFIPSMSFKNALSEAAKYLSIQIPGKGKSTFTKHFEGGVMVVDHLVLDVKKEDVLPEWLFVPSDGRRGSGKRVKKCFPLIPKWSGVVTFAILDETITEEVFKYHLEQAGNFIGLGRFRPRNNGYYGRFKVDSINWQ